MICKPSCLNGAVDNDWVNSCNLSTRKGGIPRLLFLKCDPDLVLPHADGYANVLNWKWLLCNGYLWVSGNVLGQKPKGTFTKKRTQSCGPEETVAGQKTITFQDYNADNDTLLDYDFWDFIQTNKKFMKFGWVSCDERVHQFAGDWDFEGDYVEEDNSEGNTFFDGVVTMSTKDIITPIKVSGILALFDGFNSASTCYN